MVKMNPPFLCSHHCAYEHIMLIKLSKEWSSYFKEIKLWKTYSKTPKICVIKYKQRCKQCKMKYPFSQVFKNNANVHKHHHVTKVNMCTLGRPQPIYSVFGSSLNECLLCSGLLYFFRFSTITSLPAISGSIRHQRLFSDPTGGLT